MARKLSLLMLAGLVARIEPGHLPKYLLPERQGQTKGPLGKVSGALPFRGHGEGIWYRPRGLDNRCPETARVPRYYTCVGSRSGYVQHRMGACIRSFRSKAHARVADNGSRRNYPRTRVLIWPARMIAARGWRGCV